MKSLLVMLMVHLLGTQGTPLLNGKPVYVVPAGVMAENGEFLRLVASDRFGEEERRKWQGVVKLAGGLPVATELCYRSAYRDLRDGAAGMEAPERKELLVGAGGYHGLARVAVRWCNISLRKLDVLPFGHPELVRAEKSVREQGYLDDLAYLAACRGKECADVQRAFARGTVGIPLDAEK